MSLFGTDGIRGRVGEFPIDPHTFLQLGAALGHFAQQRRVLIAKDTRLSGYMLESALCAGLTASGCDVLLTGPLPTPALAYLTHSLGAELGIMISASHNLYEDNGVKIFFQGAHKLSDFQQNTIESLLSQPIPLAQIPGKIYRLPDPLGRYIEFLKRHVTQLKLNNKIIILDCAHGSAYKVAPQLFEEYQAALHVLNYEPNGFNINEKCGVVAPQAMEDYLLAHKSDYAIAFDGDADRMTLYIQGKRCDPHYVLLLLFDLLKRRTGYSGGIIGTPLHNTGLKSYCASQNIPWIEVPVGDRYLIAAARETGFKIAGEPSGHYILMDHLPTADGLLTALLIIEEIELGFAKPLAWFEEHVALVPSFSYTYPVATPKEFMRQIGMQQAIDTLIQSHAHWKILVRPSGTEPLIRLHIEGLALTQPQAFEIYQQLQQIIDKERFFDDTPLDGVLFAKKADPQLEASMG